MVIAITGEMTTTTAAETNRLAVQRESTKDEPLEAAGSLRAEQQSLLV